MPDAARALVDWTTHDNIIFPERSRSTTQRGRARRLTFSLLGRPKNTYAVIVVISFVDGRGRRLGTKPIDQHGPVN